MEVDEKRWPIVTVRWLGVATDDELNAFLALFHGWLERKVPFGLLLDSRGAQGLTSEQRQRVLKVMKDQSDLTSKFYVQAILIDNMIQRSLYYAANWVFPFPFPSKAFEEPEPAVEWLANWLRSKAPPG